MAWPQRRRRALVHRVSPGPGGLELRPAGKVFGPVVEANVDPVKDVNAVVSVKNTSEVISSGLIFKVQIGAYKNNVPFNLIESYLAISDKGITQQMDERGLHIFYAGGSFKDFNTALNLRTEIVGKGVTDAFVVALKDGKSIPLTDEMKK